MQASFEKTPSESYSVVSDSSTLIAGIVTFAIIYVGVIQQLGFSYMLTKFVVRFSLTKVHEGCDTTHP